MLRIWDHPPSVFKVFVHNIGGGSRGLSKLDKSRIPLDYRGESASAIHETHPRTRVNESAIIVTYRKCRLETGTAKNSLSGDGGWPSDTWGAGESGARCRGDCCGILLQADSHDLLTSRKRSAAK
jgi:hypothetical protein